MDWDALRREGLSGLVIDRMLQLGHPVPDALKVGLRRAMAYQMGCCSALEELSHHCQFPLLTFKGCALAFGVYPRSGQRSFGDIDVAVPVHHWPQLLVCLEDLGWNLTSTGTHTLTFVRGPVTLDLHRHPLNQLEQLVGPPAQEFWSQASVLSEKTGQTLSLSSEHELVLALLHAAKHAFSKATWLVDIAVLANRLEPEAIQSCLSRFQLHRHWLWSSYLIQHLLGISLSPQPTLKPNLLDRYFLDRVVRRSAPDFLGSLTPLAAAPSFSAGAQYLTEAMYPGNSSVFQRTSRLWSMLTSLRIK